MSSIDPNFKSSIHRYDQKLVIAGNRHTAIILPVRLKYQADGYEAGTLLARNTTDGLYQAYNDAGSSGINTAACVLLEAFAEEDFSGEESTDSTLATAVFGSCVLYKNNLVGYDANGLTDLKGTLITLPDSTVLMKF